MESILIPENKSIGFLFEQTRIFHRRRDNRKIGEE